MIESQRCTVALQAEPETCSASWGNSEAAAGNPLCDDNPVVRMAAVQSCLNVSINKIGGEV